MSRTLLSPLLLFVHGDVTDITAVRRSLDLYCSLHPHGHSNTKKQGNPMTLDKSKIKGKGTVMKLVPLSVLNENKTFRNMPILTSFTDISYSF
jgi:hypothetical protein